jgi:hypothetical protein
LRRLFDDRLGTGPPVLLVHGSVSGAHHAGFEAVCDVLEAKLGAERAFIPRAGNSVQRTGAPFNDRVEEFLSRAVRPR